MKSAVTVSLVEEARGGPFVFWHDLPHAIRRASELGFDAVEIFPSDPRELQEATLRRLLGDSGLKLAAMGTGAGWVKHRLHLTLPNETNRRRARDFIKSVIDCAGPLGAPAILGSMQGRSGDGVDHATAQVHLAEALEELGEHAKQYGVPFLYEPLNRYETTQANSVEQGLALVGRLHSRNVKLLCDLFHMNIEEVDIAAALRRAADAIGHVHFVDSNRRPAGMGHLDYGPIIAALRDVGYQGYLSAEALPYPDSDTAAQRTIEAFRRWVLDRR